MRITLLLCISILLMCGCSRIKSSYEASKENIKEAINEIFCEDFYYDLGGRDYRRVPLIAPYELMSLSKHNDVRVWDWYKRRDINNFGGYGVGVASERLSVEYAGISDSTIYLCYTEALIDYDLGDNLESRRFVIIDVPTDSIEWHETREKWLTALNKRGIAQPQLHNVDSLYDDFANNNRLLFNPSK